MKYYEFKADQTYCEIDEDGLIICSFAEGNSANPDKYLILQRMTDDDSLYNYEINGVEYSGEGGFKQVELTKESLIIDFEDSLVEKYQINGLLIEINNSVVDISSCLQKIFDTLLSLPHLSRPRASK